MKLYSGRLPGALAPEAAILNASLPIDRRLAQVDVRGSIAWAHALAETGVITPQESEAISQGLLQILDEFNRGSFHFVEADEDIHTAVERRLAEVIGEVAGKLHTGRSRNDQVATDFRLWVIEAISRLKGNLCGLQSVLVLRAESDFSILMPGYTHTQPAQPVLLSHWWLSHFWALQRDRQRLADTLRRTRTLPLGSGALAGTPYPVDRFGLASDLGFDAPTPNSLDAVADRDFAAEFLFTMALIGVHLSRMADALILFSSAEFGFITLDDAFSTGSSLMPQKKNPDMLELTRGKTGALIGRLAGLLAMLKGLPSAYDRDLQEDKQSVFEAVEQLDIILPAISGLIATLRVNSVRTRQAISWPLMATDLADYLVQRGIPFRQAHAAVGQAVRAAEKKGVALTDLPLQEWKAIHSAFDVDLFAVFDPEQSVSRREVFGGTAPKAVSEQLALARQALECP